MLAVPRLTPVTCGCDAGVVSPARIVTDAGDTVTFVVSLLLSVTVTPPAGAGAGKVTVSAADCPRLTLMLGILIAPAL
jgi:hypothetical protein